MNNQPKIASIYALENGYSVFKHSADAPCWQEVIENGLEISTLPGLNCVWYTLYDLDKGAEVILGPHARKQRARTHEIFNHKFDDQAYVDIIDFENFIHEYREADYPECKFCGKPASMSWEYCTEECRVANIEQKLWEGAE